MRRYLPSLLLVAALATARAQTPGIDETTFLARLAQTDPRPARIAAQVDATRAELAATRLRPNPSVSLEREEVFPDGGGLSVDYLRLELPFELSGRRGRRVAAAQGEVDAVAIEGEGEKLALTVAALRRFRTAAYARLHVELLRTERDALVKAVEVVRKRTSAGAASGYDLQRIQLELAAYDDLIAAAEATLASERALLGALAGAPDGIDAADPLALPADPPPLDTLLRDAVERRPEFRAAAARLASGHALFSAATRALLPDIVLSGGLVRQDLALDQTASGYTAGVFVTLPLFDHGQADRARGTALVRAAEAERAIAAREVPAQIRASHATLARTLMRAQQVRDAQLGKLEQLLRSAETAYREGGGNVVELLDAYTKARDTRLHDLELRRDARLAELDLWLALGRRP